MSLATIPCELVPVGNFDSVQEHLRETCEQLAEAKVLIESQRDEIAQHIKEAAELRVMVRTLERRLETLRSLPDRELAADRLEIGRECVTEVLNDDPEAIEGYATFEREDNDQVLCSKWTWIDDSGRDWLIELAVEPATKTRSSRLAYFCHLKKADE